LPNPGVPVIVYDESEERASFAAETLTELGYQQVSILRGGIAVWRAEGRPTISGVNVPSKAFGEKVYHERSIPEISADELIQLQRDHQALRNSRCAYSRRVWPILYPRCREHSRRRSHFMAG
jgi:3-mercaptopyruvate sulfurtransferase SseA